MDGGLLDDATSPACSGANGRLLGGDLHQGMGNELCPVANNNNLDPEAPANYNYGRRRSRAVLYQLSGHYKTAASGEGNKAKKIHSKLSTNVSAISLRFFYRSTYVGALANRINLLPTQFQAFFFFFSFD